MPLTVPSRPEQPPSVLGPVLGSAGEARQRGHSGVSSQLTNQKSTGRSARASGTFLHQYKPRCPLPPVGPRHCIPGEDRGLAPAGPCSWQPRQGHGCARKPERGLQVLPPGAPMQAGPLIQGQGPGGRPGGTPNVGAEQQQAEYRTPASLSAGKG